MGSTILRNYYEYHNRVSHYWFTKQEVILIPEQQLNQSEKGPDLPKILLITGLMVVAGSIALTFGTESRWVGHAVASIIGLILMVTAVLTGMVQKGRIRTIQLHHIFRYHKMASTWFGLFVIGTFVLGLLTSLEHGEPLLESPHGIVGLVLVFMAIIQLVPSLLIRKRDRIRVLHRVTGYAIVPMFIIQTILGISAAGIRW